MDRNTKHFLERYGLAALAAVFLFLLLARALSQGEYVIALIFDGLTDVTADFRSVYSTAFANFLGVDPVPIVGGSFPTLGFV